MIPAALALQPGWRAAWSWHQLDDASQLSPDDSDPGDFWARIGRVNGHGIAGNVCRNFPSWLIWSLVGFLFTANTINVAADLGAMADAARLVIGGSAIVYVFALAIIWVLAQIFIAYQRYVAILKWLTLVLFAYVIALAVVKAPWADALERIFIPKIEWSGAFLTTLVALAQRSRPICSSGNPRRRPRSSASI